MADKNRIEPAAVKQNAAELRDVANSFIKSVGDMSSLFSQMSDLCRSEDSKLSKALNDISSNYTVLLERGYYHFDDLALRMENWADVTIKFEEEAAEKIQKLNSGLNDISGLLNQLK